MLNEKLLSFEKAEKCRLKYDQSAKNLTTFGLGGKFSIVIEPTSLHSAMDILHNFHKEDISYKIIGAGSNVVISDDGITSPVFKLPKEFAKYYFVNDFPDSLESLSKAPKDTHSNKL